MPSPLSSLLLLQSARALASAKEPLSTTYNSLQTLRKESTALQTNNNKYTIIKDKGRCRKLTKRFIKNIIQRLEYKDALVAIDVSIIMRNIKTIKYQYMLYVSYLASEIKVIVGTKNIQYSNPKGAGVIYSVYYKANKTYVNISIATFLSLAIANNSSAFRIR